MRGFRTQAWNRMPERRRRRALGSAGALAAAVGVMAALAASSPHCAVAAPAAVDAGTRAAIRLDVDVTGFEGDFPFTPLTVGCEAEVQVWQATEDARDGAKCAALSFRATAGQGAVGLRGDIRIPGRVEEIRLWVRGDASGRALAARIEDAGGETHVVPLGRADFAGWRRLAGSVRDGGEHYGGDGDGRIVFPIRLTGICVEGVTAGSAGVLYFDGLSVASVLSAPEQVTFSLVPSGLHAVFDPGKREVALKARNYLPHPTTVEYSWQLADPWGGKAGAGAGSFGVTAAGSAEQRITLPEKRIGSYVLTAIARGPGIPARRLRLDLAILPPPTRGAVQESRLGLNIPGALDEAGRSLVRLSGAGWVRIPIRWGEIEKVRGQYVVEPALDDTLNDLSRSGVRVVPVLQGGNALYPEGDERAAAWAKWCREMARRWGSRHPIRAWEVACPAPGAADRATLAGSYAGLLTVAGAAIAGVDEDATVVAASPLTGGDALLGDVIRAAGEEHLGGVSTQAVCAVPAGRIPSLICWVPALLGSPRKPSRLLITTLDMQGPAAAGDTEITRAGSLAYALLAALAEPSPDAVLLPGLKESNARGTVPDGLVQGDLTPTPAFAAYNTVASLLAGMRLRSSLDESFAGACRFERGRAAVVAFWSRVGETTFAVETDQREITWTDLMGNTRTLAARGGLALVPAGPLPGFLRLPAGAQADLRPILIPPGAPVAARPGKPAVTQLRFRSPYPPAPLGLLRLACPPGWQGNLQYPLAVGRGSEQSLSLVVTPPAQAAPGQYSLQVTLQLAPGAQALARAEVQVQVDAGPEAAP